MTVLVDLNTLETASGELAELLLTGAAITPETARRIACDAKLARVGVAGDSAPLDVGRSVRTVTPAQRKALIVRDRGCRFPGCDRPASWCDAHHILHWVRGGLTDLCNLILLCRHHHTLIHLHRFTIAGTADRPVFLRPDGTPLPDDRPP